MMTITTSLARAPLDTSEQSRSSGSGEGSSPSGFDDVFAEVNRPAMPGGTPADASNMGRAAMPDTASAPSDTREAGGLADLLSQLTATPAPARPVSPMGPVVSKNLDGVATSVGRARTAVAIPPNLGSMASTASAAVRAAVAMRAEPAAPKPAADVAADPDARLSPPVAAVQPVVPPGEPASPEAGGAADMAQTGATPLPVAPSFPTALSVAPTLPTSLSTSGVPDGSQPATMSRSGAPTGKRARMDPSADSSAPGTSPSLPSNDILAALLGVTPPPPATGNGATDADAGAGPRASLPVPTPPSVMPDHALLPESAPGLPTSTASDADTSVHVSTSDAPLKASLDAKVMTTSAAPDRTLVSVLAQQTHFPAVTGPSVASQLAQPIVTAAKGLLDAAVAPTAAAAPVRTLDVMLSPGDLGTVTISMRLVDGNLHLGVEAEDAGTASLIERDKATLASALHASGYTVGDLTIVHGAAAGAQTSSDGSNASASQDQRFSSGGNGDASGSGPSGGGGGESGGGSGRWRSWTAPDVDGDAGAQSARRPQSDVYL